MSVFLTIMLAISACSVTPPNPTTLPIPTPVSPQPAQVDSLDDMGVDVTALATARWWLDYHQRMSANSSRISMSEFKSAESALKMDNSVYHRLRIISLLSLRDAPFHNPERALKMLDEILLDQHLQLSIIHDSAALIKANILSAQQDQKKILTLTAKVKELQNNNLTIQNQLDALKEIEKSMYERKKVEVTNKQ